MTWRGESSANAVEAEAITLTNNRADSRHFIEQVCRAFSEAQVAEIAIRCQAFADTRIFRYSCTI